MPAEIAAQALELEATSRVSPVMNGDVSIRCLGFSIPAEHWHFGLYSTDDPPPSKKIESISAAAVLEDSTFFRWGLSISTKKTRVLVVGRDADKSVMWWNLSVFHCEVHVNACVMSHCGSHPCCSGCLLLLSSAFLHVASLLLSHLLPMHLAFALHDIDRAGG